MSVDVDVDCVHRKSINCMRHEYKESNSNLRDARDARNVYIHLTVLGIK